MKRPRMDVNLEELDRVLDHARQAPLSETDYEKLKNALHALAGMPPLPRTTEKTKAVLGQSETPARENDSKTAGGHGRNGASSYTGAKKVVAPHPTLHAGGACPGKRVKYTRRKSLGCWCGYSDEAGFIRDRFKVGTLQALAPVRCCP